MNSAELKKRTKDFSLAVIRFIDTMNSNKVTNGVMTKQLIRAATAVGANYRAACRSRSRADFISKVTIVEEEADECSFWLEMLKELNIGNEEKLNSLLKEANELTAIFTASGKTAKSKGKK